jgi:uncharacterized protein (TIGR02145 family)
MRFIIKPIVVISLTVLSGTIIFSCRKENKSLPIVTTAEAWYITQTSAETGGTVISDGGASIVARGVCWSKSNNPTTSNYRTTEAGDIGSFVCSISVKPGTKYYVRAYATNEVGTGYGNQITFETNAILGASVITAPVSSINSTSAVSGGFIAGDGGGSITSKGVCWGTSTDPTLEGPQSIDGTGVDNFVSQLNSLSSSTTYYVRAYVTNEAGTAYGSNVTFKTLSDSDAIKLYPIFNPNLTYGTVIDADWNVYKTIRVGTQVWMAENLKTTSYKNYEQIANVTDSIHWANYTLDAYCWYNNDIANKTLYGAFYNWYAVSTGKLCPIGWHVPSKAEFITLITFLGGESAAGGKLKENGTTHWLNPNTGAANESGFTALPGGYRPSGNFMSNGTVGYWWSSTESNTSSASFMLMRSSNDSASITAGIKADGMSVRCIKD